MNIPLIHHRGFHNYNKKDKLAFDTQFSTLAENGLAALKRAAADPQALGMEFDVEFCQPMNADPDTCFCIFHDENLLELNGEDLKVEDLNLSQLSLKASQTKNKRFFDNDLPMDKIPSFKEAMLELKDYQGTLSIELKKNISDAQYFAKEFKNQFKYLPKNAEVIFHSFSLELMRAVVEAAIETKIDSKFGFNFSQSLEPSLNKDRVDPTGLEELQRLQEDKELFGRIGYFYPDFNLIKSGADKLVRDYILNLSSEEAKPIIPWTVNDSQSYRELKTILEGTLAAVKAVVSDNHSVIT